MVLSLSEKVNPPVATRTCNRRWQPVLYSEPEEYKTLPLLSNYCPYFWQTATEVDLGHRLTFSTNTQNCYRHPGMTLWIHGYMIHSHTRIAVLKTILHWRLRRNGVIWPRCCAPDIKTAASFWEFELQLFQPVDRYSNQADNVCMLAPVTSECSSTEIPNETGRSTSIDHVNEY